MNSFEAIRLKFILDKQRFQTGLTEARKSIKNATSDINSSLKGMKAESLNAFNSMKNQVPGLAGALSMLNNPFTIAATGAIAMATGLNMAANKAAKFEQNFRQIKNLNLEKSGSEYGVLKKSIRDVAFQKGLDQNMASTAFYDVQSVTGKYGEEVARIVAKQGEFSQLVQANMNNYVSGTAKAMANFGFGAEKLDEFNRSAFATVKVGVTTFDQLASVMSVYAGAAASAKQDFNTANKMLAMFTVKTKSVDEAATLTKSLFNDLTKESTIKALKKIGISMYDMSGNVKQADTLLLELQSKFRTLGSDEELIQLKNAFTGSEGLIAYIQAATDKSGQLINTFETFNGLRLDMDKLRTNANDDYLLQLEKVNNRTDILISRIGDKIVPFKIKILEGFNWVLEQIDSKFEIFVKSFISSLPVIGSGYKAYDIGRSALQGIRSPQKVTKTPDIALGKSVFSQVPSMVPEGFKEQPTLGSENNSESASATSPANTISGVTESAKQVRNITINIRSFVEGGINTANTSIQKMDAGEIERLFNDMFLKLIRNAEMSY